MSKINKLGAGEGSVAAQAISGMATVVSCEPPGAELTGRMVNGRFEVSLIDGIPAAYLKPRAAVAIGVRAVLAGAYRAGALDRRAGLTHAVVLHDGEEAGPLCRAVRFEHLCDVAEKGPPTCPICANRVGK
jgi:hypothetical protein